MDNKKGRLASPFFITLLLATLPNYTSEGSVTASPSAPVATATVS